MRGLHNRLRKLEERDPAGLVDVRAEARRWSRAAERLLAPLPEPARAPVWAYLHARLDILKLYAHEPRGLAERRAMGALLLFRDRLADDRLFAALLAHPAALTTTGRGWLSCWLSDLCSLQCALPAALPPAALREVIAVYVERAAELDTMSVTCPDCGCRRPHLLLSMENLYAPDVFPDCPACRGTGFAWTHLITPDSHPWQAAAAAVLDHDD